MPRKRDHHKELLDVEEVGHYGAVDEPDSLRPHDRYYVGTSLLSHPSRMILLVAICLALEAGGTSTHLSRPAFHASSPNRVTPLLPPMLNLGPALSLPGTPVTIANTNSELFVLTKKPSLLIQIDTVTQRPIISAAVPAGASQITYDQNRLWVIASSKNASYLREFEVTTVAPVASLAVNFRVLSAAAWAGQLWLGSVDGLRRVAPGARKATRVSGLAGPIAGVVADPARDQILVLEGPHGSHPSELVALDIRTGHLLRQAVVTMTHDLSIAIISSDIWIAGYGGTSRVVHLSSSDLSPVADTAIESSGYGATVWPGEAVVWIQLDVGEGSANLLCADASSGRIRGRLPGSNGPIASMAAQGYAIIGGSVLTLNLTTTCFPG